MALGSWRQYCCAPCRNRVKYLKSRTKLAKSPRLRAKKLAVKKAWRDKNPRRLMSYKRKGRLAGTQGYRSREVYLEKMRAINVRRAKEHRAWARDNQTMKGRGVTPTCDKCGEPVAYSGIGRVPLHPQCRKQRSA